MRRVLAVLALLVLAAVPVLANGGQLRVSDQPVGPYLVTVFTSPSPLRAGAVDISVLVTDPQNRAVVNDAQVTVSVTPIGTTTPGGSYPATQEQATNKLFYAAKFDLPAAGQWRVAVEVVGAQGSGTTTFDVDAGAASPISAPVLVTVLAVVPLVIAWRLAQAQRRRLRQAPPSQQERS